MSAPALAPPALAPGTVPPAPSAYRVAPAGAAAAAPATVMPVAPPPMPTAPPVPAAVPAAPPAIAPVPAAPPAISAPPAIGGVGAPPAIGNLAAPPAIGGIAGPGAQPTTAPPAIGNLGAPPAIGGIGGPAPAAVPSGVPQIGSLPPTPSQRVLGTLGADQFPVREPYEPPTAKIPDPPEVAGKWVPEYTRDKRKYVVPGLDGLRQTETFTRATSHAKTLDDSTNLTDWRLRGTVLGLARNPELLDGLDLNGAEHISQLDFGDKLRLSGIVNKAMRRVGGDDGSDFGTKLHGYLQAVLEGACTFEQVPAVLQPYLVVLFAAMRKHGYSFVQGMVERTVFIPATGMVGTFDFLALTPEGELLIGDLKTSSSINFSWLSIAIQLAQYANAQMMLSWDGSRWEPMPAVSKVHAVVASVPKDEPTPACRIYTVDMSLGTEMMDLATRVQGIHETALRCASNTEMYRDGDELIAWAIGENVTLAEARTAVA